MEETRFYNEPEPTYEEKKAELDRIKLLAIKKANKPKKATKEQLLERLQHIYTKQSIRIAAIQIGKEFATDSEYIKAQLQKYELRCNLATEEEEAFIQANKAAAQYVAYARTVLDKILDDLVVAINSGKDVSAKLNMLDRLKLTKENITKESLDNFLVRLEKC